MKLAYITPYPYDKKHKDIKKAGIYIISNSIDNRCYIGSTKQFKKRFKEHFSMILYDKHHSQKLQNFVNKYGSETLWFSIVEVLDYDINLLEERENYYIKVFDSYHKGFNMTEDVKRPFSNIKFSDERKKEMSIRNSGNKNPMFGKKHTEETKKLISEIRKENPIKQTPEQIEAFVKRNKEREKTEKQLQHIINLGKRERTDDDKLKLSVAKLAISKKILQYDLEGNFIKEWNSITEIENSFNIKNSDIGRCCKYYESEFSSRVSKQVLGFIWNYKINNVIPDKISLPNFNQKGNYVYGYDNNNQLIKKWNSIHDCSNELNICEKTVHKFNKDKKEIQGLFLVIENNIKEKVLNFDSERFKKKIEILIISENKKYEFNSITEGANFLNVTKSTLSEHIKNMPKNPKRYLAKIIEEHL